MVILDKKYYSITEVTRQTNVKPYILRYWEKSFNLIRPIRLADGKRRYTQEDINTILILRELIYDKKYSVLGAKKEFSRIKNNRNDKTLEKIESAISETSSKDILKKISYELKEILNLL